MGLLDTAGCCAAAKAHRVLSCLRSLTVALSQQARLMRSDHHDRRHPCPSSCVCVSLRPDQPCYKPGACLVRLKSLSLTGPFPVTAKIEVNRSAPVHVRGASADTQKATRRNAKQILRLRTDEHVAGPPACRLCSINKAPAPIVDS